MIRIDQLKCAPSKDDKGLIKAVSRKLGIRKEDILELGIIRKSLDARKKPDTVSGSGREMMRRY